jgi:hypothetical protein
MWHFDSVFTRGMYMTGGIYCHGIMGVSAYREYIGFQPKLGQIGGCYSEKPSTLKCNALNRSLGPTKGAEWRMATKNTSIPYFVNINSILAK